MPSHNHKEIPLHTTRFENTTIDLTIDSEIVVPVDDGDCRMLIDSLRALSAATPLKKFDVVRNASEPTEFSYEFEANDGRKWKQTIWVPESGPSSMLFNVSDPWTEDEFIPHRTVRAICTSMIRTFGVSKVKVRW